MPADRLAIPLQVNPARQKFWRAVGFMSLLLGAIALGYLIDRVIHYRTSPQRWPTEANLEIRLIKTPRITNNVRVAFTGVQALPGTPWDIPEALTWSKREFILYSNGQEIIGLRVDGDIPESVIGGLQQWGWQTIPVGQRTLIVRSNSQAPGPTERHLNTWLTLPIFDGNVTLKDGKDIHGIPFRFSSPTSLDFPLNTRAFTPTNRLTLSADTQLTGSFALSPDLSEALLPKTVPATFPGLSNLGQKASIHGLDVLLGTDKLGAAFAFAMPNANFSLEELGEIATEGASLQNLSTVALTSEDLPTSTEIRGTDKIAVNVSNNNGLAVAIAKTSDGNVFRLTQSATTTIVSNRETFIGLESAKYTGSCLKKPQGYLSPKALSAQLPGLPSSAHHDLVGHLLELEEIAYRKNWLRICW